TAQNLHRPRVDRGRARVIDDAVAAFDDKSLDPARAEIGSEGETDGPGTDDQDRDVLALVAMTPYDCERTKLCGRAGAFLEQIEAAQYLAIAHREDAGRALGAMADH